MKRRLIEAVKGEKGQALLVVLILLVLGGLLIAPLISYAATSLNSGRVVEEKIDGLYAADAGIENALWRLKNAPPTSYPYSYQLSNINGLSVTVSIEQVTTLWGVVVGSPGVHSSWMEVDGSLAFGEFGFYVYIITVTNKHESVIHVDTIIVKLPPNFEYIPGTTAGSFTTDDPEIKGNPASGVTLVWDFQPPRPVIEGAPDPEHGIYTIAIQVSLLTGPPDYVGGDDYVWVVATRQDIGCVGASNAYKITAQAKDGQTTVMTVEAGALKDSEMGTVLVSCWEINPSSGA